MVESGLCCCDPEVGPVRQPRRRHGIHRIPVRTAPSSPPLTKEGGKCSKTTAVRPCWMKSSVDPRLSEAHGRWKRTKNLNRPGLPGLHPGRPRGRPCDRGAIDTDPCEFQIKCHKSLISVFGSVESESEPLDHAPDGPLVLRVPIPCASGRGCARIRIVPVGRHSPNSSLCTVERSGSDG